MANETTRRSRSSKSASETTDAQIEETIEETTVEEPEVTKKPLVPKKIDPNQIVTVLNGFQGELVYKSKRTGETWKWESFGASQDMELSELKNARNSNKNYFIKNWFMFEEDWIIDYLGMRQYYKNSLPIKDFDKLFEKSTSEIEEVISKLSEGQRKSVAYRAKELIADGSIDSNKVIVTLEKCLGTELIER